MTTALHSRRVLVLGAALALGLTLVVTTSPAAGRMAAPEAQSAAESSPIMKASGTFEVKLSPLETYTKDPAAKIGRMAIDKRFSGDLEARSQGEMLSGGSPSEGSAGYVAIERVTGTLGGREGSFLLQHSGTMTPTAQGTTITVVPASGTGELEGIAGSMSIRIENGRHSYEFEYTLPGG
jgi:hypothetical protein